jgi:hypothetical protein
MAEYENIYDEKKRLKLFNREKKKLTKILEKIAEDKMTIAEGLIHTAAWQRVMLTELKEMIQRDGYVERYQNGENQFGIKKSSAVEVYDKTVNTYSKIIKQLCELLPEEDGGTAPGQALMDFISR